MPSGLDKVAAVMKATFKVQRMQAEADKEKFGDWNKRLAGMLTDAVLQLYADAARSAKARREMAGDFEAMARARAIQSAREINETTSTWLQEGRELDSIFGPSRVVAIAATEAAFAKQAGVGIVSKASGKRLRWKVGRKPCKWCRSVNGHVVKYGKPFGIHHGITIYHPPAHPHCYCKVEVVD